MISSEQLATLVIKKVIFHDVPNASRSGAGSAPTLSEIETDVNARQKTLLQKKLTKVIGSKHAYPIQFNPIATSTVPAQIKLLTEKTPNSQKFVASTQLMANDLFEKQISMISPGLLCVIEVAAGGQAGVVLMKLERHEGAQLKLSKTGGKRTFSMSVLEDLVLTDSTRLFKAAMFVRTGSEESDFVAAACDSQLNVGSSEDLAKFWLKFLGCTFIAEPRVTTQRFFDASVEFINHVVTDGVVKNDLYASLHSELKSKRTTFSPRTFIEEYVPDEYRAPLREHLETRKVSLTAFQKDTSDIDTRLRRRSWETSKNVLISVPEDQAEIVTVTKQQVVVHDSVLKVK